MTEKIAIDIQANDQFSKVFGKASLQLRQLGDRAKEVGKNLTLKLTAPLVGIGTAVLAVAANFEKSMNKVRAVTQASGEEMSAMEKLARQLGATTQFSAGQAAEGLTFLSMAGFTAKESMAALPAVLNLAAAGNITLGVAADKVSNIMTQFGIDASETGRVTDLLTETFTTSNTDLLQLADAMNFAGSVAGTLGIELEETSAVLGILADSGKQATLGGTALRGILTRMIAPTQQASEIMKELGINVLDSGGNLKSVASIVKEFEGSAVTAGEVFQIFGQRAGPGFADLLKVGSAAIEENTAKLKESGGRAKEVADVQMKGLTGALKTLKSALEELALAIAKSGLLEWATGLATGIATLVRKIAEGNPKWFKLGVILAGVAAAAGPLILLIGLLLSPIGLVVGAIVGVGGAIAAFVLFREEIAEGLLEALSSITTPLVNAATAVANFTGSILRSFVDTFVEIARVVKQFLLDIDTWLNAGLQAIIDTAGDIIKGLLSPFEWLAEQIVGGSVIPDMVDDVAAEFGKMQDAMETTTGDAVAGVNAKFKEIEVPKIEVPTFVDPAAGAIAGAKGPVTGAVTGITGVSGAVQGFQAGGPMGALAGFAAELILKNEKMQEVLGLISETLVELFDPIAEAIAPSLEALVPILKELAPVFKVIGKAVAASMLPTLLTLKFIKDSIRNLPEILQGLVEIMAFVGERIEAVTSLLATTIAEPLVFVGEQLELTAIAVDALAILTDGLEKAAGFVKDALESLEPVAEGIDEGIGFLKDSLDALLTPLDKVIEPIKKVAAPLKKLKDTMKVLEKPITKIAKWVKKLTNAITGKSFQHGGPFGAGQLAMVGEAGPELVRFNRPGVVIPNDKLGSALGGNVTVNINVTTNGIGREGVGELARMLEEMAFLGRFNPRVA